MTEYKFSLMIIVKGEALSQFVDDETYQKTILKRQNYERSWMGEKVPAQ